MALITEHDDRTLVERFRGGDNDAFRVIVSRYHSSLYANALRRLRDPEWAEDAVQETLLRAFKSIDNFEGDYRLDAWLHRIVTNVCADIGRRKGRDSNLVDKVSGEVETSSPAADDGIDALADSRVKDALEALPDGYREAVMLRFMDELSYEDVATSAGISEQNARARVSRGRTMMRSILGSASAAVVWLIPPLRRHQSSLTGTEADTLAQVQQVAHVAAPAAAQASPALTQVITQAAPVLAQVAPSAPMFGKAAVAVGIAATMAIPAGVAVEQRLSTPEPAVAAPSPEVVAPTTTVAGPVGIAGGVDLSSPTTVQVTPSSGDTAVPATLVPTDSTVPAPSSTTTTVAASTTTPTTVAPAPTTPPPPAEEPPPAGPNGDLVAEVSVVEAGPRLDLDGGFTLDVDGNVSPGTLSGKVLIGDADAKNADAPRSVDGTVTLTFDDGTTADLRVRGQVVVTTRGANTTYDLTVQFRLDGGAAHGLAESGSLNARLDVKAGRGNLHVVLPGAPAGESADEPAATDPSGSEPAA